MKPYLIVSGDFVKTGGMDRANYALAEYLAKQGYETHLVAHRVASELKIYSNIITHLVPKIGGSYFLSSPLLDQAGWYWAKRISKKGGRVIVNGGNCHWNDVNWVHYVHAAYEEVSGGNFFRQCKVLTSRKYFLNQEQKALTSAHLIIANSDRTKRDLIEKLGITPQKIHTVYYGIDPQVFCPATSQERTKLRQQFGWPEEKPIVVFIGALGDYRKGFDILFEAWQKLCADSKWDADLIVIGSGKILLYWQRAIEHDLSLRIHFLGFQSDVSDLLRAADCLVSPTRYEAYGLAVHEAICCGLPAIVSESAGIAERYLSNLNDLLLPNPEDVNDLINRLRHWQDKMSEYRKLACDFSQNFCRNNWDDMSQKIVELIENPSAN